MKKLFSFDRPERIVLIIGILLIAGILALAYAKESFVEETTYVPVSEKKSKKADTEKSENLSLKQDTFLYVIGETLDQQPATYLNNTEEVLKKVTLDFTKVNAKVAGTYEVSASDGTNSITFIINVVATKNPVMTTAHPTFSFYLDAGATVQEVINYAGVTAKDVYGNDISNKITGWPASLPTTVQRVTYPLTISDEEGNTSTVNVTVRFLRR